MAGTVVTAAVNNINIVNGTASLDVAAASAVDVNANLTVNNATTLTGSPYTPAGTDVPVTDGGTGVSTLTTAYGLLAAGTTATGAVQTLPAGLTTEIPVGGGASALPVWTTATGSGAPVRATSPTLVTPLLGTPTSGTLTNCTSATAADNTSTTAIATTAYAKSQDAVLAREPDQGVALTAAGSGSSGITVADNDNIDFGTGNFALVWKGSLPDWTTIPRLFSKYTGSSGIILSGYFGDTSYLELVLNADIYASSADTSFVNNTVHEIIASVTNKVGAVNGSIAFYVDGVQLGSSVAITTAYTTVSNAVALQTLGYDDVRQAGTTHHAYLLNFAPTAAEVLDAYRNGIPESWKWGSQTALINDSAGSDNTANYTSSGGTVTFDTDHYLLNYVAGTTQYFLQQTAPSHGFKRVRLSVDVKDGTLSSQTGYLHLTDSNYNIGSGNIGFTTTAAWQTITLETTSISSLYIHWGLRVSLGTAGNIQIRNISFKEIGATACYLPELINGSLQWPDASTNNLHALLPVSGATQTRPAKTFTIKGTNTWAGTHEPQSINSLTDDSRAILQAGCYITDIIGVIAGGTIEDIIIGDGSDTDHWVSITTGLAAGTVAFTVANRISDGTNYEMVIDPDANFTGSISWTVRGIIL